MGNIPLINNLNPKPTYNGYTVTLGETPEHLSYRPTITKIGNKKIPIALIGASTPSQIFLELKKFNAQLSDVVFIHCGKSAQDIYDYLNLNSRGWDQIRYAIPAAGYTLSDIQWVIMCHDDLTSNSNIFPAAAQVLADKEIEFIKLMKTQMPNLKVVDLFSRLSGVTITQENFIPPSDYHNSFSAKFAVEASFATNHLINGVWLTDAPSMWTDGEVVRSDGFAFRKSWMKTDGGPHMVRTGPGPAYCANWLFNYCKRYPEFK